MLNISGASNRLSNGRASWPRGGFSEAEWCFLCVYLFKGSMVLTVVLNAPTFCGLLFRIVFLEIAFLDIR